MDVIVGQKKVTLHSKLFSIDTSNLEYDVCNIGAVLVECGMYEAELRLEVSRKEAALDKLYADMDAQSRMGAKSSGDRITEGQIKNIIIATPTYSAALDSLHESTKNANIMRWVMTALQKKADCLLSLSYRERQLMKLER